MTSIDLNENNCIDLLKRYIDIGYKTGMVSIKEGAMLHKYFRILKGTDKDDEITNDEMFQIIFKALNLFNSKGAFNLDDASVIDTVMNYIQKNMMKNKSK